LTVSTLSSKPGADQAGASSGEEVHLIVTGVDIKGQMFRHPATLLMLQGRDCEFRSESQPELGGSVLAEFNYPGADANRRISQARVKSTKVELESGTYKVVVELETAQSAKVGSKAAVPGIAPKKPEPQSIPAPAPVPVENKFAAPTPVNKVAPAAVEEYKFVPTKLESKAGPAPTPREFPFPRKSNEELPAPLPVPQEEIIPVKFENRNPLPKTQPVEAAAIPITKPSEPVVLPKAQPPEPAAPAMALSMEPTAPPKSSRPETIESPKMQPVDPAALHEAVKSAVALQIKFEMALLKTSVSSEVEKALPVIIASKMEKMIREDVEKQISSNYESSMQTLSANVVRQVEEKISQSRELRANIEGLTKKLFEEQAEQSKTAGAKSEQELNSRAASTLRSVEDSLSVMEARIHASRAEMESALANLQTTKQEINESMSLAQEAVKRLRETEKAGVEKMQSLATSQLREWAEQFENMLSASATEKAVQFSLDMERRMAPHRQRAEETEEKLGAMLQLMQGTVRAQQDRLTEHAMAAATSIEKEIKAFLVRLGGGA
jgi:hypothetical protein